MGSSSPSSVESTRRVDVDGNIYQGFSILRIAAGHNHKSALIVNTPVIMMRLFSIKPKISTRVHRQGVCWITIGTNDAIVLFLVVFCL